MKFNFWKRESTKTKWLPIHAYQYGYDEYMVFARLDHKTGLFDFKTKPIANHTNGDISRHLSINADKQFYAICYNL